MDIRKLEEIMAFIPNWKIDKRVTTPTTIINGLGQKILITQQNNHRWEFNCLSPTSANAPRNSYQCINHLKITINPDRKPHILAKEINTRLIIKYTDLYQEALSKISKQKKLINWCDNVESSILSILGKPPVNKKNPHQLTNRSISFGSYTGNNGYGEIKISSLGNKEVSLDFAGLPTEKAIKLIHFYKNSICD